MDIVNDKNFDAEVKKSNVPVIIDCFADWCGPCKNFAPIFEDVSKNYKNQVKFVKLNVDDSSNTGAELSIRSIPTVIFFNNGVEVSRRMGAVDKAGLKEFID
ncbi:thioredoxin, partial [Candidatus Woesearchaeota archaeon]|nr:thioredoxin [Candidatus Woesearchaeota archaeon]